MQKLWRKNSQGEIDHAGKYAKHMLKDWVNKRLTTRIEIKEKMNIVDKTF